MKFISENIIQYLKPKSKSEIKQSISKLSLQDKKNLILKKINNNYNCWEIYDYFSDVLSYDEKEQIENKFIIYLYSIGENKDNLDIDMDFVLDYYYQYEDEFASEFLDYLDFINKKAIDKIFKKIVSDNELRESYDHRDITKYLKPKSKENILNDLKKSSKDDKIQLIINKLYDYYDEEEFNEQILIPFIKEKNLYDEIILNILDYLNSENLDYDEDYDEDFIINELEPELLTTSILCELSDEYLNEIINKYLIINESIQKYLKPKTKDEILNNIKNSSNEEKIQLILNKTDEYYNYDQLVDYLFSNVNDDLIQNALHNIKSEYYGGGPFDNNYILDHTNANIICKYILKQLGKPKLEEIINEFFDYDQLIKCDINIDESFSFKPKSQEEIDKSINNLFNYNEIKDHLHKYVLDDKLLCLYISEPPDFTNCFYSKNKDYILQRLLSYTIDYIYDDNRANICVYSINGDGTFTDEGRGIYNQGDVKILIEINVLRTYEDKGKINVELWTP